MSGTSNPAVIPSRNNVSRVIREKRSRDVIVAEDCYRRMLLAQVSSETEWLDLGCGWQLLREWLPNGKADQITLAERARRLVGIDRVAGDVSRNPYLHEKVVGDFLALPFADDSFNLVTAQMVVEHIERPLELLREVKRVLRPGGIFIFLTPNFLNYQVFAASFFPDRAKKRIVRYLEFRNESDVFKAHYRMNTRNKNFAIARAAGLTVEELQMAHSAWEFRRIPPLLWIEKTIFQFLDLEQLANFRSCILGVLSKPPLIPRRSAEKSEFCKEERRP
jgi:ubiquinone/menaquinone biosynthesis C-methylase UbiE